MENYNVKRKASLMDRYIAWFEKWMPESLFICFILTLLIAFLAIILTDAPIIGSDVTKGIIDGWAAGFWGLLAFTMQMTVLLATGSAVASSPPAKKALSKLAQIPKTRTQFFLVGAITAGLFGYIHWGLGMMVAIVFGRELLAQAKKNGIKIHAPLFVATLFFGFLPAAAGISGAAVLYAATPGYLKSLVPDIYMQATPDAVTLAESVFNLQFILLLLICMFVPVLFAKISHPKDESKIIELNEEIYKEILSSQESIYIPRKTPSEKANGARWIMYLIGGIIFGYSVIKLVNNGIMGLDLNSFNFLSLGLGMLLCANWGPEYYGKLFKQGVIDSYGFIIQFPFYAGIFGIISSTGLGIVISHAFTSISTTTTWPIIAYIYSALLNIAVPSGGSKFIIEAPYIIPTSLDLGVNIGKVLQAYQMGDATTNLIIPFFALPYLSNFKLKFNQIVAYTVPCVGIVILLTISYLLIF